MDKGGNRMGKILVSVIVPVYNVAEYLEECVRSLFAQTYRELEIILIDDGSSDGSGQLCDAFAAQDSRVRVIHQENAGVSAARNAGLDAARGEYICFVDGDDWTAPEMVAEAVSVMEREGCDICSFGHFFVEEDGEKRYFGRWETSFLRFQEERQQQRFLCRWLIPGRLVWSVWCRMFRKGIIEQHGLRFALGQRISEDLDFTFRYLAYCQNLYYLPKPLYNYRQRGTSAVHSVPLAHWAVDTLEMVRRQARELSGDARFRDFSIYSGTVLAVLLDNFLKGKPVDEGLAEAVGYFRASDGWEWLLGQARAALRNPMGVLSACGLRIGLQVIGFYHCLLSGKTFAFRWAWQIQTCYVALRELKNKLLRGLKEKP